MTHPKARSKPRRRERRNPADRNVLTPKRRALLAAMAAGLGPVETATLIRAEQQHEQGCLTPCAPNRGNDAPATLPANTAGTAGAPPAHPAGKSEAAPLANQPETDMRYYRPHINDANAAADAIAAHDAGRIHLLPDQYRSCELVNQAFADGAEVTQECICRAHDAIERMRR